MNLVISRRQLAPAAVIAVLAALAGCASGGNSGAAAGSTSTVAASAVASISARPPTPAKSSTASVPTPTAVASTPRGAQTASALLDSALSAMQAQQSFHVACTATSSTGTTTDSLDSGVASARDVSDQGDYNFKTILVDGIAYLNIDNAGVWESEGIPQAEADKLAGGEWLSIGPGQSYGNKYLFYAEAIGGLTMADQVNLLRLSGTLKRTGATTAQGVSVYGVSGHEPPFRKLDAEVTLYIAATGAPLPVSETTQTSSSTATCNYTDWDKPLNLTAPSNVLPITAIPS